MLMRMIPGVLFLYDFVCYHHRMCFIESLFQFHKGSIKTREAAKNIKSP